MQHLEDGEGAFDEFRGRGLHPGAVAGKIAERADIDLDAVKVLGADVEELKDRKNRRGIVGWMTSGRDAWRKRAADLEPPIHDPSVYDLVVLGGPVWAFTICSPTRTYAFAQRDNFKQVAFMCTLGDYKGIEIERPVVKIEDADIERAVDGARERFATHETAADAEAADGDQVVIDFKGTIDGEPFTGGAAENYPYILGSGRFFKEFEEALRGAKAGAELTCKVPFPEDYSKADLAGKTADKIVSAGVSCGKAVRNCILTLTHEPPAIHPARVGITGGKAAAYSAVISIIPNAASNIVVSIYRAAGRVGLADA